MARKNENYWFYLLLIVVVIWVVKPEVFDFLGAVVVDMGETGKVNFENQDGMVAFTEGDTLVADMDSVQAQINLVNSGRSCAGMGIKGYTIFVDDLRYSSSGTLYNDKYTTPGCKGWKDPDSSRYSYSDIYGSNELKAGSHYVEIVYNVFDSCCSGDHECCNGQAYDAKAINVAPAPCVLQANDFLGFETFSAGSTITESSLRFPVKKFCYIHPPIVTDKHTFLTYTDSTILAKLENAQTVTVPEGKTYSIMYVFENDGSIPVVCNPEQAYNVETETCIDTTGIVTICTEGTFDPIDGVCVIQGITICEEGYHYDTGLAACVMRPDETVVCEKGTYDAGLDVCIYYPDTTEICPQGDYNPSTGNCEVLPYVDYIPPTTNIIKLTMKNSGGQSLYDINLVSDGTTPDALYNAFSGLKTFSLGPDEQAVFYANLDTTQFDGVVPFQMNFEAKYDFEGTTYSLYRYTEPLTVTFDQGVII